MRLYVIGPVTGKENRNWDAFMEAAAVLRSVGYQVRVPHQFINPRCSWQEAMRISIVRMLDDKIDGVAMLEGVASSRGASLERRICDELHIRCMAVEDWVSIT